MPPDTEDTSPLGSIADFLRSRVAGLPADVRQPTLGQAAAATSASPLSPSNPRFQRPDLALNVPLAQSAPAPVNAPLDESAGLAPPPANDAPPTDRDAAGNQVVVPVDAAVVASVPKKPRGPAVAGSAKPVGPSPSTGPDADAVDAPVSVADAPAPAAPASPYVNPTIARYMAAQEAQRAELKAAQAQALPEQNLAAGMAATRNARHATAGRGPDDSTYKAQMDAASRPVTNLLARREQDAKQLEQSSKEQEMFTKADESDKNSDLSKAVAKITGVPGVPAKLFPQVMESVKLKAKAKQDKEENQLKRDEETGRNLREDKTLAAHAKEGALNRGNAYAIANLKNQSEGKQIGDTTATALSNIKTGQDEINDLDTKIGGKGALSRLWAAVPATENNVWQAHRSQLVESTANALAGGKKAGQILVKKVDESFPQIGDTEDVKKQKIGNLNKMLGTTYNNQLDSLHKAGKNVSQYQPLPTENGGSAATAPTHYSYSADRKQRIPVDASGNPLGPVEDVR